MNAERLLAHYERISDAPDAIARLRCFILELAMRGKIVPQDSGDEPAIKLLKLIAIEKMRDNPRRQEAIEIDHAEELGDLPKSWCVVPLIALGIWAIGAGFPKNEQGLSDSPYFFLKVSDMNLPGNEKYITTSNNGIDDDAADRMRAKIHPAGTIIFPKIGGAIATNKRRILTKGSAIDNNCLGITFSKKLDIEWAYLLLTSLDFTRYQVGTAVPALQQGVLERIPVGLPPLAEQHRIVAKVEELMALCDRLEAARAEREATRDRLVASTLARLNTPDPATFQADARFALNTIPALTTRPDQIKQLRQTILNLAVRGKLVPQDPKDEPINVLLSKAMARRAALVRTKTVRLKKLDGYDSLVIDSELPASWKLERLGNLVDPENTISYGVLVPGDEVPDGIPFVRAQDLALSGHPERPNKTISPEIEKAYARTRLHGGEILVCVVGSIGKLGIVPLSWAGANIARAVARILPIAEISREYLLVVLRGEPVQTYFTETTRTLAQPTLNIGLIEQTPIPLPPLAEQHRIVAKVDALMKICDQLEASLDDTATTRRHLLDALLAGALMSLKIRNLEAAE